MKELPLEKYLPEVSRLAYGCMGFGGNWNESSYSSTDRRKAFQAIEKAMELGINFFDHADIYTRGKAESIFGEYLAQNRTIREKIYIQTKGAIRLTEDPIRYDFSKEYIRSCVEGSLKRLNTDYIDIWMLHRPDPLMEPEEIAEVFDELKTAGKVRYFGVSNMHVHQLDFLQNYLSDPIVVNQIEMSLVHLDWLDEGVLFNHGEGKNLSFSPGIIEYCRKKGVQIQSWGSLAQGLLSGRDTDDQPENIKNCARLVNSLAEKYQTSKEGVVLGWLLRHPSLIQPVIGTINPSRITDSCESIKVNLSREDWYKLYVTTRGSGLP